MTKYMINHEKYILSAIENGDLDKKLQTYHQKQIKVLQHERLIHLLVMMLCLLVFMLLFIYMMLSFSFPILILNIILFVLGCFYVWHYYVLENTVQRWYEIDNTISLKLDHIGTNIYK